MLRSSDPRRARAGPAAGAGFGDEGAVVELALKFSGLEGLRVVDTSIIPAVASANINACVFLIAEKAADLIPGNAPLTPQPVLYHRAT